MIFQISIGWFFSEVSMIFSNWSSIGGIYVSPFFKTRNTWKTLVKLNWEHPRLKTVGASPKNLSFPFSKSSQKKTSLANLRLVISFPSLFCYPKRPLWQLLGQHSVAYGLACHPRSLRRSLPKLTGSLPRHCFEIARCGWPLGRHADNSLEWMAAICKQKMEKQNRLKP